MGEKKTEADPVNFPRHLPQTPNDLVLGLRVIGAGFTDIHSGEPYPRGYHTDEYMLSWARGRVLNEYQMIYITQGSSVLENDTNKRVKIESGDVFFVIPGQWHRYRPDLTVGWNENWIGFNGAYADQIMPVLFDQKQSVLHVGHDEELLRLMQSVATMIRSMCPNYQQMMAGNTVAILTRTKGLAMRSSVTTDGHEHRIYEAQCYLLEHACTYVDLEALATQLGYSYTRFRAIFKQHTGLSLRQCQIQIRINHAEELLAGTNQSMTEIADHLGFSSAYYFSRLFKQKTGFSPSAFRNGANGTRPKQP